MDRRIFLKSSSALTALLALPSFELLDGCTVSAAEIKADGAAISQAVLNVAQLETGTLASDLRTAASTLLASTQNWTTGSATNDINTAAIALEAVLAAIPQTAAIAPLIPIAVAAIDLLIANLPSGANGVAGKTIAISNNPYRGKAKIHHLWGRSPEADFRAAWDGVCKKSPALKAAQLK